MKRLVSVIAIATATLLHAADAPPPKAEEAPPPKHKLGGGFKGHAVSGAPGEPVKAAPRPAAAPKKGGPALVIDNRMVKGAAGESSGGSHAASAPPPAATPPPPPPPVEMPKIVDLQGHDEAYWRARAASIREAVQKAQDALGAAEADEKRQESDFYSWDDGQYRDNVIKPAWDRAKEEAARARENLAAAQKDLDGLEDEARRAGAYPGWIR